MSDISSWYPTAASNTAAAPDGWPEGMSPADVNNCARENMAAMKRVYNAMRSSPMTNLSASGGVSAGDRGVSYNGTIYVAVTSAGSINTNTDAALGSAWTSRTSGVTSDLYAVVWASALSLFCAVGGVDTASATILTSPDGITWTRRTSGVNTILRDVCWCAAISKFVAVGDSVAGADTILTSADGITWTARTGVFAGSNSITSVDFNGSNLVVCSTTTLTGTYYIQSSPDGVTWTGRTVAGRVRRVSHDQSALWVATYDAGVIYTSSDGITWTARTSNTTNNVYKPYHDGKGQWVVGTANTYELWSADGITWTKRYVGNAYAPKSFMIDGPAGRMIAALGNALYISTNVFS